MAVTLYKRYKEKILKGIVDFSDNSLEYTATALNLESLTKYQNTDFITNNMSHSFSYIGTGLDKEVTLLGGQVTTIDDIGLKIIGGNVFNQVTGTITPTGTHSGLFCRIKITPKNLQNNYGQRLFKIDSIMPEVALKYGTGFGDYGVLISGGKLILSGSSELNVKGVEFNVQLQLYNRIDWSASVHGVIQLTLVNTDEDCSVIFYHGDDIGNRVLPHGLTTVPQLMRINSSGATQGQYSYLLGTTALFTHDSLGGTPLSIGNAIQAVSATGVTLESSATVANNSSMFYEIEVFGKVPTTQSGIAQASSLGELNFTNVTGIGSLLIVDFTGGNVYYADLRTFDSTGAIKLYDYTGGDGMVTNSTVSITGTTVTVQAPTLAGSTDVFYYCLQDNSVDNYLNQNPVIDDNFRFLADFSEYTIKKEIVLGVGIDDAGDLTASDTLFTGINSRVDAITISFGNKNLSEDDGELLLFYSGSNGLPYTGTGDKIILDFSEDKLIKVGV